MLVTKKLIIENGVHMLGKQSILKYISLLLLPVFCLQQIAYADIRTTPAADAEWSSLANDAIHDGILTAGDREGAVAAVKLHVAETYRPDGTVAGQLEVLEDRVRQINGVESVRLEDGSFVFTLATGLGGGEVTVPADGGDAAAFLKGVFASRRPARSLKGGIVWDEETGAVAAAGEARKTINDFVEFVNNNRRRCRKLLELLKGGATIRLTRNLGDTAQTTEGGRVIKINAFVAKQIADGKAPVCILDNLALRNEDVHRNIQRNLTGETNAAQHFAIEVLATIEELKGSFELGYRRRNDVYSWIDGLKKKDMVLTSVDEFFELSDSFESEEDLYTKEGLQRIALFIANNYPEHAEFADPVYWQGLPGIVTSVLRGIQPQLEGKVSGAIGRSLARAVAVNAPVHEDTRVDKTNIADSRERIGRLRTAIEARVEAREGRGEDGRIKTVKGDAAVQEARWLLNQLCRRTNCSDDLFAANMPPHLKEMQEIAEKILARKKGVKVTPELLIACMLHDADRFFDGYYVRIDDQPAHGAEGYAHYKYNQHPRLAADFARSLLKLLKIDKKTRDKVELLIRCHETGIDEATAARFVAEGKLAKEDVEGLIAASKIVQEADAVSEFTPALLANSYKFLRSETDFCAAMNYKLGRLSAAGAAIVEGIVRSRKDEFAAVEQGNRALGVLRKEVLNPVIEAEKEAVDMYSAEATRRLFDSVTGSVIINDIRNSRGEIVEPGLLTIIDLCLEAIGLEKPYGKEHFLTAREAKGLAERALEHNPHLAKRQRTQVVYDEGVKKRVTRTEYYNVLWDQLVHEGKNEFEYDQETDSDELDDLLAYLFDTLSENSVSRALLIYLRGTNGNGNPELWRTIEAWGDNLADTGQLSEEELATWNDVKTTMIDEDSALEIGNPLTNPFGDPDEIDYEELHKNSLMRLMMTVLSVSGIRQKFAPFFGDHPLPLGFPTHMFGIGTHPELAAKVQTAIQTDLFVDLLEDPEAFAERIPIDMIRARNKTQQKQKYERVKRRFIEMLKHTQAGKKGKMTVAVFLDSRCTGPELAKTDVYTLLSKGVKTEYGFIGSVCEAAVYVKENGNIYAVIYISASHNPKGENGIKLFLGDGRIMPEVVANPYIAVMRRALENPYNTERIVRKVCKVDPAEAEKVFSRIGEVKTRSRANEERYRDRVISGVKAEEGETAAQLDRRAAEEIGRLKAAIEPLGLAVILDNNGGAREDREYFERIGIRVYEINSRKRYDMNHDLCPTTGAVETTDAELEEKRAEAAAEADGFTVIGSFHYDTDGDRRNFRPARKVGDRWAFMLRPDMAHICFAMDAVNYVLDAREKHAIENRAREQRGEPLMPEPIIGVVCNGPSTILMEELAEIYGFVLLRTQTGEANVVDGMDLLSGNENQGGKTWADLKAMSDAGEIELFIPDSVRDAFAAQSHNNSKVLVVCGGEASNGSDFTLDLLVRDPLHTIKMIINFLDPSPLEGDEAGRSKGRARMEAFLEPLGKLADVEADWWGTKEGMATLISKVIGYMPESLSTDFFTIGGEGMMVNPPLGIPGLVKDSFDERFEHQYKEEVFRGLADIWGVDVSRVSCEYVNYEERSKIGRGNRSPEGDVGEQPGEGGYKIKFFITDERGKKIPVTWIWFRDSITEVGVTRPGASGVFSLAFEEELEREPRILVRESYAFLKGYLGDAIRTAVCDAAAQIVQADPDKPGSRLNRYVRSLDKGKEEFMKIQSDLRRHATSFMDRELGDRLDGDRLCKADILHKTRFAFRIGAIGRTKYTKFLSGQVRLARQAGNDEVLRLARGYKEEQAQLALAARMAAARADSPGILAALERRIDGERVIYGLHNETGELYPLGSNEAGQAVAIEPGISIDFEKAKKRFPAIAKHFGAQRARFIEFVHAHELGHAFCEQVFPGLSKDEKELFADIFAKRAFDIRLNTRENKFLQDMGFAIRQYPDVRANIGKPQIAILNDLFYRGKLHSWIELRRIQLVRPTGKGMLYHARQPKDQLLTRLSEVDIGVDYALANQDIASILADGNVGPALMEAIDTAGTGIRASSGIPEGPTQEKIELQTDRGTVSCMVDSPDEGRFPGPRPIVLLFHGYSGHKTEEHLEAFAAQRAKEGYIIIRPDFVNGKFGDKPNESTGALVDYTIDGAIEDVASVVKQIQDLTGGKADLGNVQVAGHSMGGFVATVVAAEACSNEGSPFAALKDGLREGGLVPLSGIVSPLELVRHVLRQNKEGGTAKASLSSVFRWDFPATSSVDEVIDDWRERGAESGVFGGRRCFLVGEEHNWEERDALYYLRQIPADVPISYIVGTEDDLVLCPDGGGESPARVTKFMEEIQSERRPGAVIVRVKGAGHKYSTGQSGEIALLAEEARRAALEGAKTEYNRISFDPKVAAPFPAGPPVTVENWPEYRAIAVKVAANKTVSRDEIDMLIDFMDYDSSYVKRVTLKMLGDIVEKQIGPITRQEMEILRLAFNNGDVRQDMKIIMDRLTGEGAYQVYARPVIEKVYGEEVNRGDLEIAEIEHVGGDGMKRVYKVTFTDNQDRRFTVAMAIVKDDPIAWGGPEYVVNLEAGLGVHSMDADTVGINRLDAEWREMTGSRDKFVPHFGGIAYVETTSVTLKTSPDALVYSSAPQGAAIICCEFVEGPTLQDILDSDEYTPTEKGHYRSEAMRATGRMWAHRGTFPADPKPANLMFSEKDGRFLVTDLDIIRRGGLADLVTALDYSYDGSDGIVRFTPGTRPVERQAVPVEAESMLLSDESGVIDTVKTFGTEALPLAVFGVHPDDIEDGSVALQRELLRLGNDNIHWAVLTTGADPTGVSDESIAGYGSLPADELTRRKDQLRRAETVESAQTLGVSPDRVTFFGFGDGNRDADLDAEMGPAQEEQIIEYLKTLALGLPAGASVAVAWNIAEDAHAAHTRGAHLMDSAISRFIEETGRPVHMVRFRQFNGVPEAESPNLYVCMSQSEAAAKYGEVLSNHQSQIVRRRLQTKDGKPRIEVDGTLLDEIEKKDRDNAIAARDRFAHQGMSLEEYPTAERFQVTRRDPVAPVMENPDATYATTTWVTAEQALEQAQSFAKADASLTVEIRYPIYVAPGAPIPDPSKAWAWATDQVEANAIDAKALSSKAELGAKWMVLGSAPLTEPNKMTLVAECISTPENNPTIYSTIGYAHYCIAEEGRRHMTLGGTTLTRRGNANRTYVSKGQGSLTRIKKSGEPTIYRVPVEALAGMTKNMEIPRMIAWLQALNEAPNIFIELYSDNAIEEEAIADAYDGLGLTELYVKKHRHMPAELRDPKSKARNQTNTITLLLTYKTQSQKDFLELIETNESLQNSIPVPISSNFGGDTAGLVRGITCGSDLVEVARNPANQQLRETACRRYQDTIRLQGMTQFTLTTDDIADLISGDRQKLAAVIKKLADGVPAEALPLRERIEIYRHAELVARSA